MGEIYIKSFLPFDRKLILVSDQLFLYKSRPNFPSIFTAMHLLINSIDTAKGIQASKCFIVCKNYVISILIYIILIIAMINIYIYVVFMLFLICGGDGVLSLVVLVLSSKCVSAF